MERARVYLALGVLLAACGGRSDLFDTAAAPGTFTCTSGDSPVELLAATNSPFYEGIATDGNRLYVMQEPAPFLWSIDVRGGAPLDLYAQGAPGVDQAAPGWPMFAFDGGVYFDAPTGPSSVMWVNGTGGPLATIATPSVILFDWSGTRAFRFDADLGTVDVVALSDGSSQPFATPMPLVLGFGVTSSFFHVLTSTPPSLEYTDRRFGLADGTLHDDVGLDVGSGDLFTGPTTACLIPPVPGNAMTCLADDEVQPNVFALSALSDLTYIDDTWAYVNGGDSLLRVSLSDGHEQAVTTLGQPIAVTTSGGCVYAALMTSYTTGAVWRFSP